MVGGTHTHLMAHLVGTKRKSGYHFFVRALATKEATDEYRAEIDLMSKGEEKNWRTCTKFTYTGPILPARISTKRTVASGQCITLTQDQMESLYTNDRTLLRYRVRIFSATEEPPQALLLPAPGLDPQLIPAYTDPRQPIQPPLQVNQQETERPILELENAPVTIDDDGPINFAIDHDPRARSTQTPAPVIMETAPGTPNRRHQEEDAQGDHETGQLNPSPMDAGPSTWNNHHARNY